jgi:hypothetical protein
VRPQAMSDLCLSTNPSSSDFILSCPAGDIILKRSEYEFYSSLFQALDSDDDGRVRFKDVIPVLQRTGVLEVLYGVWVPVHC